MARQVVKGTVVECNAVEFTEKEIKEIIAREEKHIKRCEDRMVDIQADIRGTKNAIRMWKQELKLMKKGVK